jgi:hypothetical protein
VPVVAVSSPGILLSSRVFDVRGEELSFLATNLVNDGDIVPKIDQLRVRAKAAQ